MPKPADLSVTGLRRRHLLTATGTYQTGRLLSMAAVLAAE
jgi:hypothetical protein